MTHTTPKQPNVWHDVTPKDQKRIQCQKILDNKMNSCGKPATRCEHVEWNTGNTKGISFWYYCPEHAQESK